MALISPEYLEQQQKLHERPDYGAGYADVHKYITPIIERMVNQWQVPHLLDYGCGKGALFRNINPDHKMRLQAYDPAIPECSEAPAPAPMVACLDVLEHVEPEHLEDVLDDLERVTERVGVFSVHTGPAAKTLADGRNAHLIQMPPRS